MCPRGVDEGLRFVIDRCLGKHEVPEALRAAGMTVEVLDNHFDQDCPDSRTVAKYTRPLIATVSASGAVTVLWGQQRGGVRR